MGKKSSFPYVLSVRLSGEDGAWLSEKARSLRLTESSLARILIGVGMERVQNNPSLIFGGGADFD